MATTENGNIVLYKEQIWGYAALKAKAFSYETDLGIVKALPALGSRLAKVFQSVIEAFQLVLFPPTRVSI